MASYHPFNNDCAFQPNYTAVRETCNQWRNYADVYDSWSSVKSIAEWTALHQDAVAPWAGPGGWNDPDMVELWRNSITTWTLCNTLLRMYTVML